MINPIEYIRTSLNEEAIVTSLLAIRSNEFLSPTDEVVLSAFQRYSQQTGSIEETQSYLQSLSADQIPGVVSNVKGILHEMEYVRIENEDGDEITASLFADTNHPGYDVILSDAETGETWEVQLKSTDNTGYVQEWIDEHPDGEILVTNEIAEKLDIPSSGFENEELTVKVNDFVDLLLTPNEITEKTDLPSASSKNEEFIDSVDLWYILPALPLLSVALIIYELHKRYRSGELSLDEFKRHAVRASGINITKISLLIILLNIPVVNVVVGAALIAKLILWISSWTNQLVPLNRKSELTAQQYLTPPSEIKS